MFQWYLLGKKKIGRLKSIPHPIFTDVTHEIQPSKIFRYFLGKKIIGQ